jgi:glycosyltransferase involved in cell wall biosynthesis
MITTLIPTYKRPELLESAIRSALNQSYSDIIVSVFDNASNDETESVILKMQKQDSRIVYKKHPKTISAVENFQLAISSVKTPFFSILADDDLLAPYFYEIAKQKIGDAAFFLGSTLDITENGRIISASALNWEEKYYEPPLAARWVIQHYFNWTGTVFRTEIAQKHFLDKEVKPIDFDFILRMAMQYPCVVSKTPCAFFIQHSRSYSSASGLELVWPSWAKIEQNVQAITAPGTEENSLKPLLRTRLYKHLIGILAAQIKWKDFTQAKKILRVLQQEFPKRNWFFYLKLFPCLETRLVCAVFEVMLFFYRTVKRMPIQFRYGKQVKEILRTYRNF